jgi:hypothetical protein
VKHFASPEFWEHYQGLPAEFRELADKSFDLLKANPSHPWLRLKKVGRFWSARVGRKYRALAVETAEGLIWFWVGKHADYDEWLRS